MRHSWASWVGASAAVAVVAGTVACEDPGTSGTFKSKPRASSSGRTSASANPCASQGNSIVGGIEGRKGLIIAKIDFAANPSDRSLTLRNLNDKCTPAIDTSMYVLAYEVPKDATMSLVLMRIKGGKTIAGEATMSVKDSADDLDPMDGATATSLGLDPAAGALALFRDATTSADLRPEYLADYVQYGTASVSYRFADMAKKVFIWDDVTKYASGSSEAGKALEIQEAGQSGSSNWVLK